MLHLFVHLPNSRQCETEADSMGLKIMAKSCYDPRKSIEFWERMNEKSAGIPEFLSTHPHTEHRVDHLRKLIPEAMQIYENGCFNEMNEFNRFWK